MGSILQIGIVFIVWLQGLGTWLLAPMKFFSFLGSEEFFMVVLPVLYWSVDAVIGLYVGTILLFTSGLNDVLKLVFHGPRPYWVSTQVKAFASETSFGVPSGHAQRAMSMWGMAAARVKRPWAWGLAIFVALMIGISRLYLAVHFLHDVLLGWLLGTLVLWVFVKYWEPVSSWVKTKSPGQQILLAFLLSAIFLISGAVALGALKDWTIPAEWITNAMQAGFSSSELPAPVSMSTTVTSAATLFGLLAGLVWINTRGGFRTDGSLGQRVLRILPGLIGILVLYLGLGAIFPRGDSLVPYIFRYIRYALIGFWVSGAAPWIFIKLKLAA